MLRPLDLLSESKSLQVPVHSRSPLASTESSLNAGELEGADPAAALAQLIMVMVVAAVDMPRACTV